MYVLISLPLSLSIYIYIYIYVITIITSPHVPFHQSGTFRGTPHHSQPGQLYTMDEIMNRDRTQPQGGQDKQNIYE